MDQTQEERGGVVCEIIRLIQNILSEYLGKETFSILPILTKVRPSDEEFDFEMFIDYFEILLENELKN